MSESSFNIYIDESGDEGFVFNPDGSGSSRWLVLSAVIVRKKNDLALVQLVRKAREVLGRPPKHHLHFRDLKHEQRVPYLRQIAAGSLRTASVLIYKPAIREPEKFQAEKFRLYRYATRFLLERVSWLCRESRITSEGDGTAEIVFSNRSIMSYDDLRQYLDHLKSNNDALGVQIDWSVIVADAVRAVNHDQLAGLQIADAIASSFFSAVNLNRYGEVEDKYVRLLLGLCYRHNGTLLGYGLKFWPDDVGTLKATNPHLAWLAAQS